MLFYKKKKGKMQIYAFKGGHVIHVYEIFLSNCKIMCKNNAKPEFGSPLKNGPQDQKLRKYFSLKLYFKYLAYYFIH